MANLPRDTGPPKRTRLGGGSPEPLRRTRQTLTATESLARSNPRRLSANRGNGEDLLDVPSSTPAVERVPSVDPHQFLVKFSLFPDVLAKDPPRPFEDTLANFWKAVNDFEPRPG